MFQTDFALGTMRQNVPKKKLTLLIKLNSLPVILKGKQRLRWHGWLLQLEVVLFHVQVLLFHVLISRLKAKL